jgi:hypothetical protein
MKFKEWEIEGPIQGRTIGGGLAAYSYWQARDRVPGRRYSERPFIAADLDGILQHILDTIEAALAEGE